MRNWQYKECSFYIIVIIIIIIIITNKDRPIQFTRNFFTNASYNQ